MLLAYVSAGILGILSGLTISALEAKWLQKKKPGSSSGRTKAVILALILGAFFPLILFLYGGNTPTVDTLIQVIAYALLACILCAVMATDLDTMTIPNPLVIAGIVLWLATAWFIESSGSHYGIGAPFVAWVGTGSGAAALDGIAAAILYGGGILVFSAVYEQVSKKPSLGGGDIKLLFAVNLFLGLYAGLLTIFLACVIGLIFAPIWRKATKNTAPTFPFGPSIACATLLSLVLVALV